MTCQAIYWLYWLFHLLVQQGSPMIQDKLYLRQVLKRHFANILSSYIHIDKLSRLYVYMLIPSRRKKKKYFFFSISLINKFWQKSPSFLIHFLLQTQIAWNCNTLPQSILIFWVWFKKDGSLWKASLIILVLRQAFIVGVLFITRTRD